MAFKDIERILYNNTIKVTYVDDGHKYMVQYRDTPSDIWSKPYRSRGVTTIKGDTLEKKGLQLWPLGLALGELFGYYDFEPEPGRKLKGFKKGKGTLWKPGLDFIALNGELEEEELLALVESAYKASFRVSKKGCDIGTLVHDTIEQFVTADRDGVPFDEATMLNTEYYIKSQGFNGESDPAEVAAFTEQAPKDVEMAKLAFSRFVEWWRATKPVLLGAEDLIFSKEHGYCGTFDALLEIDGKVVLADWKTSNASKSAGAPQGVYYDHFIQSAAYAAAWEEMGNCKIDDMLIVSCRKDGGFDRVFASEIGLSMDEAMRWWKSVLNCYENRKNTIKQFEGLAKKGYE